MNEIIKEFLAAFGATTISVIVVTVVAFASLWVVKKRKHRCKNCGEYWKYSDNYCRNCGESLLEQQKVIKRKGR